MAEDTVRPRFKRKQLLVARKFQLKYVGVILLLIFLTATCCSYMIYYTTMVSFGEKLASVYPQGQLVSIIHSINFRILAGVVVISPLIGFLGIYLSHKIAGPIYRIERSIGVMVAGDFSSHITLRKGDEMVSLADSLNKLSDSIALGITTERSHAENALKEVQVLRELVSSPDKDRVRISKAVENLDTAVRVITEDLGKYKV